MLTRGNEYCYEFVYTIQGWKLRGQTQLSLFLHVHRVAGFFSRLYILVLADTSNFA